MISQSDTDSPNGRRHSIGYWFLFWIAAWLGIAMAGGVYGLLAAGFGGMLLGATIAAVIGLPVVLTFAALTWAFWLRRFSLTMAATAGLCSGIASNVVVPLPFFFLSYPISFLLAGSFGAVGAGVTARLYSSRRSQTAAVEFAIRQSIAWRYSFPDFFIRFAVISMLIAAWVFGISSTRAKLASLNWPDQESMVYSGYSLIPEAKQVDQLFGPAWHFTSNFQDPNSLQWFTEALIGGRYELTMVADIEVNRESGDVTKLVAGPSFILKEVSSVRDRSVLYRRSYEFDADKWRKVVAANGNFGAIGLDLNLNDPVPGFEEYQKLPRNGIQMKDVAGLRPHEVSEK